MRSLFFYFYLAVGVLSVALNTENLSGEQLKTWLQTRQSFYEAGDAFFSLEDLKARLMDKKYRLDEETPFAESKVIDEATIPASFDARTKWGSECPSVSSIRQQSGCGSCWAFSTAEVMSDRTCIHSAGKTKVIYSPEDILDCCSSYSKTCGSCDGGYPATALNYWHAKGVVTGGDYGSASGCKPYTISPTNSNPATPKCSTACRSGYSTSYANDKHFASSASYRVTAKNVAAIQTEIMNNGPVVTSFTVYEDFNHYKSGVYVHSSGKEVGGHAVKIIGWGTDNGTPYWIVANSWGASWGEKGFFRIIRGVDECGIEEYIYGATPK